MRSLVLSLCVVALGCGRAEGAPPASPAAKLVPAAGAPAEREAQPSSSLHRSELRAATRAGMGALLSRVVVDTDRPVFRAGKFLGFRLMSVPADWRVDLAPGDVIVRVNGFSVERPESAFDAFESLEVASELRVDYERNGEPRALRWAIVDD